MGITGIPWVIMGFSWKWECMLWEWDEHFYNDASIPVLVAKKMRIGTKSDYGIGTGWKRERSRVNGRERESNTVPAHLYSIRYHTRYRNVSITYVGLAIAIRGVGTSCTGVRVFTPLLPGPVWVISASAYGPILSILSHEPISYSWYLGQDLP